MERDWNTKSGLMACCASAVCATAHYDTPEESFVVVVMVKLVIVALIACPACMETRNS